MSRSGMTSVLRRLLGLIVAPPFDRHRDSHNPNRFRPMLERFEDRSVPAVVNITTLSNATEGGSAGSFRVTRDSAPPTPLTVNYTVSGTATSGSDFAALSGSVTIPAFTLFADVNVSPTDDSIAETTEEVTITLASGAGYTIGAPILTGVLIYDNETPVVSVAQVADTCENGASGLLRFTRIGNLSSSLTVNFSVSGTATSGTDFTSLGTSVTFAANSATAEKLVAPLSDNLVEGDETVIATVTSGTGYSVGSPSSATVTIHDDPAVITVEAVGNSVEDGDGASFILTRTGGDLTHSITISYSVGGTATSGTDYTALSGSVTFVADSDTAVVTVTGIDDNTYDPDETVSLTITSGSGYTIGDPDTAELAITDSVDMTFTLNSYLGAVKYDIPRANVDPEEASQSLTPTAFNLNIGGQNFAYGTANYTTAPTLLFEYGDLVGVEFELDLTGTGSSFVNISLTGGVATGIDSQQQEYNDDAEAKNASLTLDFAAITLPTVAMGDVETSIRCTAIDTTQKSVTVVLKPGMTKTQVRDAYAAALEKAGFKTVVVVGTDQLDIKWFMSFPNNSQLKKVETFGFATTGNHPKVVMRTEGPDGNFPEHATTN